MATTLMPVRGEELPKPRTFEELPILVVDASGSMGDKIQESGLTKAEDVIRHLVKGPNSLFDRLMTSRNREDLYLSWLTFDDRVDIILPRPIQQIPREEMDIPLLQKHGQRTAIGKALNEAFRVAQDWLALASPGISRYATILLMSDGQENANSDPLGAAAKIKSFGQGSGVRPKIMLATAAYGDDADRVMLEAMASNRPDGSPMFKKVASGEELRDFFIESIYVSKPGGQLN
ncbi:MAG: vWA domain-containing protein [Anaerolineales bacterium]